MSPDLQQPVKLRKQEAPLRCGQAGSEQGLHCWLQCHEDRQALAGQRQVLGGDGAQARHLHGPRSQHQLAHAGVEHLQQRDPLSFRAGAWVVVVQERAICPKLICENADKATNSTVGQTVLRFILNGQHIPNGSSMRGGNSGLCYVLACMLAQHSMGLAMLMQQATGT